MKQKIMSKLIEWSIIIDPLPIPHLYVWEVKVDNKSIHIEAINRVFAYLRARIRYPQAKHIRVIKLLNTNRYA